MDIQGAVWKVAAALNDKTRQVPTVSLGYLFEWKSPYLIQSLNWPTLDWLLEYAASVCPECGEGRHKHDHEEDDDNILFQTYTLKWKIEQD